MSWVSRRWPPDGRLQVLQSAHVVQPVGQLDEHHAHVRDHGQQHLAHVFSLAILAIGKLDFVDFGDASTMWPPDRRSPRNLLIGSGRVFDRIVQQAGGDGRRVHLHLRQHLGHLERVDDIRLAGGANLPFMMLDAELPGLADERDVFAGAIAWTCLSSASKRLSITCRARRTHPRARQPATPPEETGARWNICRDGLPGSRHASL